MIIIENVNEELYACGENLRELIRDWNHNIDYNLQWLRDDYDDNEDEYFELTRPVESFDEIMEVLIEINEYEEESCIIRFE